MIKAQWKNGMIPHIIFHENNPNYFPGPNHWHIISNCNTSCLSQPPVLASILKQIIDKYNS